MTCAPESFGRASPVTREMLSIDDAVARLRAGRAAAGGLLAFGNGRSYGDSCQNTAGALIDMSQRRRLVHLDPDTGIIEAEAGLLLRDIISRAVHSGYFPAVLPGTLNVTLGGAIANDIHGKNHHRRGTFGRRVEWLTLLRSDGKTLKCSPTENAELFAATIGGMGLTGLIVTAAIRLLRVSSPEIVETSHGFASLDEYFELAEEADKANEYAVAWIDQVARGKDFGRGVLLTGNHAELDEHFTSQSQSRLAVPFRPPFIVLSDPFIQVFNRAYRWSKLRRPGPRQTPWRQFFAPLDGVRNWNWLYGPKGLYQHQSVVPFDAAPSAIPRLLEATHSAGQASFLTVLKRFGSVSSPGLLSFPRPGYTLTLDFANRGEPTLALLEELDRITIAAGGAVNPYKDARMSPQTFESSFPNWRELERLRDPAFQSDFWRRTAGRLGAAGPPIAIAAE